MVKLQITLTDEEASLLSEKAKELGYDVTKYAKFVLAKEAQSSLENIPSYEATPKMQKLLDDALSEDEAGLTTEWKFDDEN